MSTQTINFKNYYLFPLQLNYGACNTSSSDKAFDFANRWDNGKVHIVSDLCKELIISILNGDIDKSIPHLKDYSLTHSDGCIYANKAMLIRVRGWGHLTGTGGLNLSDELAGKIQDAFGEYILERLKASCR